MNNRGPRSSSGKATVAINGLKHGLQAAAIVLPSESGDEWQDFHDEIRRQSGAEGAVELALASRAAELLWRLRRVVRAEEQFISVRQMHADALVYEREQPTAVEQQRLEMPAPQSEDATPLTLRERISKQLGIYASGVIAEGAASRYAETLPVLLPDDRSLEKVMRYEAHLSRLLNHALHELEALQARRHGNAAPLARIDIA